MKNPLIFRPHGLGEIRRLFGDPSPLMRNDGSVKPEWESLLDFVVLPAPLALSWNPNVRVTRLRCHALVAPFLSMAFAQLVERKLWRELKTFGGCYAWRPVRAATKLSTHSWGIGIDFNPKENPLGAKTGTWSAEFIDTMETCGWYYGGQFSRPDPMHFQFCTGY